MPLTDIIVLIVIVAATSASAALLWRRGVRGGELRASLWLSFYGAALIAMMMAHNVEVLYRAVTGAAGVQDNASPYTFRLYSLLLLGMLLVGTGVVCLRAVAGVSRGSARARETSARASMFVLAIVAPLIPLQVVFGTMLTGLSVVSVLVLTRRSRIHESSPRNEAAESSATIRA